MFLKPLQFEAIPQRNDPRWPFFCIMLTYVCLGITMLGFNRSVGQIATTVGSTIFLDLFFSYLFRNGRVPFPLSSAISGLGLGILVNYAHGYWLPLIPVFFTIASKYLITFKNKHVFNPTLFGVFLSLKLGNGMLSVSPAYQWGGSAAMAIFIVTAALILFVSKIKRNALILSFLGFYCLQLALRAYLTRHHIPPETLFLGAFTQPAFFLFTFFMLTDPKTSPSKPKDQVIMSFIIVLVDLILHKKQQLSTLFFAGFIYFAGRWLWLHFQEFKTRSFTFQRSPFKLYFTRLALISLMGGSALGAYKKFIAFHDHVTPDFHFELISAEQAGIFSRPSKILEQVDPRIAHVAKWVLSVGDAVAVADVDLDGRPDIFLTYPLKDPRDRAGLYRNLGNYQFERVPIPDLDKLVQAPEVYGLPTFALFFDYNNDGAPDLLVGFAYGQTRLFKNMIKEEGRLRFVDVSKEMGLTDYTISIAANALDLNHTGKLDLIIANAMNPLLPGYEKPTPLNVFHLPEPAYPGDRRMYNFFHRTWHNARNGGGVYFLMNKGNHFEKVSGESMGIDPHRWTLSIGTGDLNDDGWTDLYLANDFGPDQLLMREPGKGFRLVRGPLVSQISHDTYKGMNTTLGDFFNKGIEDIYVTDVHHALQAEGSLFWVNDGQVDKKGYKAFQDRGMELNALNENRFGWGGAAGDLGRDGHLDLLIANGMVDDAYDKKYSECPDYWYWNDKIALTGPDVHGYADKWADLRGRCIFPKEQNRVYLNRGDHFIDVAEQVGWTEKGNSRGIALVDLDNRGVLDAIVTHQFAPVSIYKNVAQKKSWIGLDLKGNGITCNRDAIGTKVTAVSTKLKQMREVRAANGFSAQGDRRLLFGLGNDYSKVTLTIRWCGNKSTEETHVLEPGRYYTLTQNEMTLMTH